MPDWSYRTLFRPVLFRVDPVRARELTVGAFAALARVPLGTRFIELLGHAHGRHDLSRRIAGVQVAAPVGLGAGIDLDGRAADAWARIGSGFIEVGPVDERASRGVIGRDEREESLTYIEGPSISAEAVARRLRGRRRVVPVGARLVEGEPAALARAVGRLDAAVDYFVVDDAGAVGRLRALTRHPVFAVVSAGDADDRTARATRALAAGAAGLVVVGDVRRGGRQVVGAPARAATLGAVRTLRAAVGPGTPIIATDGVIEPADAVALFDAGATAVQLHAGLVFSGPALPRRIKAALRSSEGDAAPDLPMAVASWGWLLAIGIGLILGGIAEGVVAATTVVLPYDETFLGVSGPDLLRIAPRLLDFMRHDRMTLAGTTIAVGIVYATFATFAVRRGSAWARTALLASAVASTLGSLALPLVYGYPDPLHVAVIVTLVVLLVAAVRGRFAAVDETSSDLHNDRVWSLGLWGQFCFVAVGAGLVLAGAVIAILGATAIFVPQDLAYLATTSGALNAANPHLLPVVAHDRSNFGSTLIAAGIPVALAALWGYRRGAAWLWWTLAASGAIGFTVVFAIHAAVGYVDAWHLAPAVVGLALYLAGLVCSYAYLCDRSISERTPAPATAAATSWPRP